MIGYIMIGTNDLPRAARFYDSVLAPLGGTRSVTSDRMQAYDVGGQTALGIVLPYDGKPASAGNGTTFALAAPSTDLVHQVHAVAIEAGAQCDGPPGPRPGARTPNFYGAYFRDPDGNKVCVFTRP